MVKTGSHESPHTFRMERERGSPFAKIRVADAAVVGQLRAAAGEG